jgi:hypothetical protein
MIIRFFLTILAIVLLAGCAKPQYKPYVAPATGTRIVEKIVTVGADENLKRNQYAKKAEIFTYVNGVKNDNAYALIIGINEYKENTNVEFADYSALEFEKLAKNTFGVPAENIITLINSEASSGQLKSKLELIKELPDAGGVIYVFYAGHGVPGKDGNTYLLPSDMSADAIHLEPNLMLNNIYKKLSSSEASNVHIFLDSCFSGKDDSGELLYRGVAPVLKVNKTKVPTQKLTVLTAGKSTDFANDYQDKQHRLFSYYLIEALSSGNPNLKEAYDSVRSKVKRASLKKGIGYKQTPDFIGNTKTTLY